MSLENLEKGSNEEKNWAEYMHEIEECVLKKDPNQLEDLLREDHPMLPSEKETFDWLNENIGRKPRVKLDKSGFHVIRAEEKEKE
jgi:hypothetical protein